VIVGAFVLLAAASAVGFGMMFSRLGGDACLDGIGADSSCPVLAVVGGSRYSVSVASDLRNIEDVLSSHAPIDRTNSPDWFSELVTYRIAEIDPTAVLAAPAQAIVEEDVGPYRLLYGPNSEDAWPQMCLYLPERDRAADQRCTE
jgi:hypothetical protein